MQKEIYEIQNLVDKYKYEDDNYPYIDKEDGTYEMITVAVDSSKNSQFNGENITENSVELYTLNLSKVGVQNLSRGYKKDNNVNDVYAFSNITGRVYYVKGYKVGNNTYYTLTDELRSLIGLKKQEKI